MYGYVKPLWDELLLKEISLYRAFFCGLCRAMRRETGLLSARALRHEYVFLALCRTLAEGRAVSARYRRCIKHPLSPHLEVDENEGLLYAASAAALVGYLKREDDLSDRPFLGRAVTALGLPMAALAKRRADLPLLESALDRCVYELCTCEIEREGSVDIPADISGRMLALVFSSSFSSDGGVLYRIGYHLGRLLYILDALDDLKEDRRREGYNPYLILYGDNAEAMREDAAVSIRLELAELSKAIEELPFENEPAIGPIIKNIVYLGLPAEADKILSKLKGGQDA